MSILLLQRSASPDMANEDCKALNRLGAVSLFYGKAKHVDSGSDDSSPCEKGRLELSRPRRPRRDLAPSEHDKGKWGVGDQESVPRCSQQPYSGLYVKTQGRDVRFVCYSVPVRTAAKQPPTRDFSRLLHLQDDPYLCRIPDSLETQISIIRIQEDVCPRHLPPPGPKQHREARSSPAPVKCASLAARRAVRGQLDAQDCRLLGRLFRELRFSPASWEAGRALSRNEMASLTRWRVGYLDCSAPGLGQTGGFAKLFSQT
ncbi:hypothetical protein JHW43_008535 [Diplocarpon mali]|nr:hypothetical protein JHW43_008535 [Diplocarpon mali]